MGCNGQPRLYLQRCRVGSGGVAVAVRNDAAVLPAVHRLGGLHRKLCRRAAVDPVPVGGLALPAVGYVISLCRRFKPGGLTDPYRDILRLQCKRQRDQNIQRSGFTGHTVAHAVGDHTAVLLSVPRCRCRNGKGRRLCAVHAGIDPVGTVTYHVLPLIR